MEESCALVLRAAEASLRSRPGIAALAERIASSPRDDVEQAAQRLIDGGRSGSLDNLLLACALIGLGLPLPLLSAALEAASDARGAGACLLLHREAAYEPLLRLARAHDVDPRKRAWCARLAAEVALETGRDMGDLQAVVRQLRSAPSEGDPWLSATLSEASGIADAKDRPPGCRPVTTDVILDSLPRDAPALAAPPAPTRPEAMAAIGRNDPCHCGSALKYKKCCYEKDMATSREELRRASPMARPVEANADTAEPRGVLAVMPADELRDLDPANLPTGTLLHAFDRSLALGFRDLAFVILREWVGRPDRPEAGYGRQVDLLDSVLEAGEVALARKVRAHVPDAVLDLNPGTRLHLEILEHPQRLAWLEGFCRHSISSAAGEGFGWESPLFRLAVRTAGLYPAISVVLARAALAGCEDGEEMAELLDTIRRARITLGLSATADPMEDLHAEMRARREASDQDQERDARKDREIAGLRLQLEESRRSLRKNAEELARKRALVRKLETAAEASRDPRRGDQHGAGPREEQPELVERLRKQVENLKAEITRQQEARGHLRRQLADGEKGPRTDRPTAPPEPGDEAGECGHAVAPERPRRLLAPTYTDVFRRSCESLPADLVARAIVAAARFAAFDKAAWVDTRRMKGSADCFSVRIGIHYRLMMRWRPGQSLDVLDLIPRENLDQWIQRRF